VSLTATTQRLLTAGNTVGYTGTGTATWTGQSCSLYRPYGGAGVTTTTAPLYYDGSDEYSGTAVVKTAIPFEMLPGVPPGWYKGNRWNGGDYNEEYDSPDFQNMFLAHTTTTYDSTVATPRVVLPSYWRPDLVAYWYSRAISGTVPLYVLDVDGSGGGGINGHPSPLIPSGIS
ncbi:MAG: hypothetical protein Q4C47_03020, partial [Planctomycetia bacterium]|nr:hypothetical protein [Planctomycetia bacterium]